MIFINPVNPPIIAINIEMITPKSSAYLSKNEGSFLCKYLVAPS